MKKNRLITVSTAVLFTLLVAAGCGSNSAKAENPPVNEPAAPHEGSAEVSYTDGTYEGSSNAGIHPGLEVSVVVKDGKIAAVNVTKQNETEGVGSIALEKLPALIVEAQSTEVDSVSGATLSSTALKEAVDKALAQAKP